MNETNQGMDSILITGLKVEAVIGVFAWERAITQPLFIDVTMLTDIRKAAASDDIQDAINYKSVCDDITNWCTEAKANLIETLAALIATGLLDNYATSKVTVTVAKPTAIQAAESVAVSITRSKDTA